MFSKTIFLLFLLLPHVFSWQLVFKTSLRCPKELHGPNGWCSEGYFYDLDTYSENDPIYFFRLCSTNETMEINSGRRFGGHSFILSSCYDMQFIIYHNCHAHRNQTMPSGIVDGCSCAKLKDYYCVKAHQDDIVVNKIDFGEKLDLSLESVNCEYPSAFQNTMSVYGRDFYERGCQWGRHDLRLMEWSPEW